MQVKIYYRKSRNGATKTAYFSFSVNGKRVRENSGITIKDKPATPIEKAQKKEQLRMLSAKKALLELQLNENKTGIRTEKGKKVKLLEFIKSELFDKNIKPCSIRSRKILLKKAERFFPNDIFCDALNENIVYDFFSFLENDNLKATTAQLYARIFLVFIHKAQKKGLIGKLQVSVPKVTPPKRNFLTDEEIKDFEKIFEGANNSAKECLRMFLFCCYTGLRISDTQKLNYCDLEKSPSGIIIMRVDMQKTGGRITAPLSEKAVNLIDKDKIGQNLQVFKNFTRRYINKLIQKHNPTTKKVSTHVGRHSFAVRLLERGADIYAVSRLLGHSSVKTTEIYADMTTDKAKKVVDLLND